MTQEEKISKQLFRLSQKALFFDPENKKYLVFKVSKPKKNQLHHAVWTKKYGPWDLPGGHVDANEIDVHKAFTREVKEESGIVIDEIGTICHTQVMFNEKSEYPGMNVIYMIQYDGSHITLSDEHVEYVWLTAQEIAQHKEIKEWIKVSVQKAESLMELQDSLNSWRRCLADFDNYKKRQSENQKEFTQYAAEGVIADMLPVLDNFHAATEHIPEGEADNPWVTGIMFIQQQMEKIFEESGVIKIKINIGDEFDPHMMETVKNDDVSELHEDAKIIKIAQPGYMIGQKVLRPARVILE